MPKFDKIQPPSHDNTAPQIIVTPNSREKRDQNLFLKNKRGKGSVPGLKSVSGLGGPSKAPLVSQAMIMQNQELLSQMIPELRNAVQGRKKSHSKVAKTAADVYF